MSQKTQSSIRRITTKKPMSIPFSTIRCIVCFFIFFSFKQVKAQAVDSSVKKEQLTFQSEGVALEGTLYIPKQSYAAVVIVHGSGQELRMTKFAEEIVKQGITVFTYDKRGVGASGGVYAGPEVGTNNIDSTNLNLLAKDVNAAVSMLKKKIKKIPIGLIGGSQAGWIIPIASKENPLIQFMVLFSCPTITTLEQLRFQFYTNGNNNFWENHSEAEARDHIKNDTDRYQFAPTDPKISLKNLSIPGLWIYGEKDIQIPVKLCIEDLNTFKSQGKLYEYTLFPALGHNTAFDSDTTPFEIAMQWIKQKTLDSNESKMSK